MSNSITLNPLPRTDAPASRRGLVAMFKAVLESLVAAQTRQLDQTGALMYRFPPL